MCASPKGNASQRVTTATVRSAKDAGRRLVAVTAYDTATARLADEAGVDVILVGDSLAMTVLGYETTLSATLDDMLRHTAAVSRGVERALVVGDMPFMTFQVSAEETLRNAARFFTEGGAAAVKLEGGERMAATVGRLTGVGIPVMGHVGLTPQSVHQFGGYRVQAKEAAAAIQLVRDCRALEAAGAFSVVLECIPAELAALVTRHVGIPTIGIGAGAECDGEIQVFHDLLGMGGDRVPKHARRFADVGGEIRSALSRYADAVRDKTFPGEEQCTLMAPDVLAEVEWALAAESGTEA